MKFLKKKKKKFSPKNENVRLILHMHVDETKRSSYENMFDLMAVECFTRSRMKPDYIRR